MKEGRNWTMDWIWEFTKAKIHSVTVCWEENGVTKIVGLIDFGEEVEHGRRGLEIWRREMSWEER